MDVINVSSIIISSETYDRLLDVVEKTAALSSQVHRLQKDLKDTAQHVSNFLDAFERAWESDEQCESIDIAEQYVAAAKHMADTAGRINNRIRDVQAWIDEELYSF